MKFKSLQHAVVLADEGHFLRAAEQLRITPSALSKSIQALETELDLVLFDRSREGVTPTIPGRHFLTRARQLVAHAKTLEREMQLLRQCELGELRMGSGPMPATAGLPNALAHLLEQHPGLSIHVDVDSWPTLRQKLERDEIEFALIDTRQLRDRTGLVLTPMAPASDGGFFCRPGHPLTKTSDPTPHDMVQFPIVSPNFPRDLEPLWRERLGLSEDAPLTIRLMCDDLSLLHKVALETDAILVTSMDVMHESVARGLMVALDASSDQPTISVRGEIVAVSLNGRSLSPAARVAMTVIRNQFRRIGFAKA